MSDTAPLLPRVNGGRRLELAKPKEVPRVFTDAELDAREAELDAVIDRIDEVLPQARAKVQEQRSNPDSRMFVMRQTPRARTAFVAMQQAATEAADEHDTGRIQRPEPDETGA